MTIAQKIVLYQRLAVAYQRTVSLGLNRGLCKACETMFLPYYTEQEHYKYAFGTITRNEFIELSDELRAETTRRRDAKEMFDEFYWLPIDDIKSRVDYVNNKINELKQLIP